MSAQLRRRGRGLRLHQIFSESFKKFVRHKTRIRGRIGTAAACKAVARERALEVRVLPDASQGGVSLNAKLADSNPVILGSNPGAPANSRKVGHGHAKQFRKLSEHKRSCGFDSHTFRQTKR